MEFGEFWVIDVRSPALTGKRAPANRWRRRCVTEQRGRTLRENAHALSSASNRAESLTVYASATVPGLLFSYGLSACHKGGDCEARLESLIPTPSLLPVELCS